MLSTAKDTIDAAAFKIGVKKQGVALETDEYTQGIRALNNLMFALDNFLRLGYTEIEAQTDIVTVPAYAQAMVDSVLAMRLAPIFQVSISNELAAEARDSFNSVIQRMVPTIDVQYPSNLPTGVRDGTRSDQLTNYFPDLYEDVIADSANNYLNDGQGQGIEASAT